MITYRHLKKVVLGKEFWIAIGFSIFLFVFEFNYFGTDYWATFELIYDETFQLSMALRKLFIHLALFFLLTVFYVGISLISTAKYRIIYFVLFSCVIIIEYGYQNAHNNFLALYDLRTALGSIQLWVSAIQAYFNPLAFIPIILYGLLLASVNTFNKQAGRMFAATLLLVFSTNLGIYIYTALDPIETKLHIFLSGPTLSLQSFFRTLTKAALEQTFIYNESREEIQFQATNLPQNNIVFIIDESVRYDHLSLNGYSRPTTPYLEALHSKGVLYNWGRTAAGSTCSYRSIALLLTGVHQLPDTEYRIKRNPTIFQYAKAMNYKTFYFDGEDNSLRFPLTTEDLQFIDESLDQTYFGNDYKTDFKIATHVTELLDQSVGNFIVIFKRGSHFPYGGNFPPEEAVWKPILSENQIVSEEIDTLVNSYDNSVKYNLDPFFQRLLDNADILETATILYTSDHGQTLGESANTHCGDTVNEASVPLFMITAKSMPIDERYKASHHNTFATLLDLMDFPKTERRYVYTLSLLQVEGADSPSRYYFYGSLFGFDEHKWLDFD